MSRILFVRLDGVGDALLATPLLAALTSAGHAVALVLSDRNEGIFTASVFPERYVVRVDSARGNEPQADDLARLAPLLATRAFGAALIATEKPAAYRLVREACIPTRVGFHNGWTKPLKSLWVRRICTRAVFRTARTEREREHEARILFRLGRGFFSADAPSQDAQVLAPLVRDGPAERGTSIGIQVTAKWIALGANVATLAALARRLAQHESVELLADAHETALASEVGSRSGIAPRTFARLAQWKDAVNHLGAFVTPDTGAAHLAGMLGVPTVDAFADDETFDVQVARWAPWAAAYVPLRVSAAETPEAFAARAHRALNALRGR